MSSEPAVVPVARRTRHPWWRVVLLVLQRAALNFSDDRGTHMAAAIAYYALFSLFPLMLLAVSVFGIVLRDERLRERVVEQLVSALPVDAPNVADSLQAVASRGPTLTLIALVGTIWSASALVTALRLSLNVAFDSDRARPLLHGKAIDLLVLPALGVVFLASLALTTAWRIVQHTAEGTIPLAGDFGLVWDLGALAIPALLTFAAFLFLYWLLPTVRVTLRHLLGGAALATLGFEVVKQGFALYIANIGNYDVVYGSLGGLMALLFWVYVTANILLFGAEVAAETPHVLREEPRHGHAATVAEPAGGWASSLWALAKGLVLAPGEQTGPAMPEHPESVAAPDDEAQEPRGRRAPRAG